MKKTMAQIIKQRIKLFLKEKYMDIFFEILRNIEQIIKEEEDNKIETIFHKYYKDKNYHPTTKEKLVFTSFPDYNPFNIFDIKF